MPNPNPFALPITILIQPKRVNPPNGGVVVILLLGLFNMVRGGSGNTSQKLMRARVIGQAISIALLMAALFFFGNGNHGN